MIDDRNAFRTQEIYARAYIFAANAHHGQLFPGSELPYLVHVSLVGAEVLFALIHEDGLDTGLAVQCALLHDVLEDTPISFERLAEEFGEEVANGVHALTKRAELPWEARMPDSLSRILRQPREIAIVKLADRIVNMSPPPSPGESGTLHPDHWNQQAWPDGRPVAARPRRPDPLHAVRG